MKKLIFLVIALGALISCNKGPKEIAYGEQECHFCRMTIVDKQYAAQIVNGKGKSYNFDAAECMINYTKGIDKDKVSLQLVTDYNNPENLIEVENATFIISAEMPSPMGANLTAVSSMEEADLLLKDKSGEIYNWEELLQYLNNQ